MVRPEGFEPPTFGSEDRRSIQLNYGRAFMTFYSKSPQISMGAFMISYLFLFSLHLTNNGVAMKIEE